MKHRGVRVIRFPYKAYKKNLRTVYKALRRFPQDLNNPHLLADYLRENMITSLPREMISHVLYFYKDDHLGKMVMLASYMTNLTMVTDKRLGRIFGVSLENPSFIKISPLYMDSPRRLIEVTGTIQSLRMHLAFKIGLPYKIVPEIRDMRYFEGMLVNYTADDSNKNLRIEQICPGAARHNMRLLAARLGRTSTGKPYPCKYCKRIHNGDPDEWCDPLKIIGRDPEKSVELFLRRR